MRKNKDKMWLKGKFAEKTYVDAVANAVIQAWKSPHQNLNGFLRMKKK